MQNNEGVQLVTITSKQSKWTLDVHCLSRIFLQCIVPPIIFLTSIAYDMKTNGVSLFQVVVTSMWIKVICFQKEGFQLQEQNTNEYTHKKTNVQLTETFKK